MPAAGSHTCSLLPHTDQRITDDLQKFLEGFLDAMIGSFENLMPLSASVFLVPAPVLTAPALTAPPAESSHTHMHAYSVPLHLTHPTSDCRHFESHHRDRDRDRHEAVTLVGAEVVQLFRCAVSDLFAQCSN